MRPGTNKAHLPQKNEKEFREFINAIAPQPAPNPRDPWIVFELHERAIRTDVLFRKRMIAHRMRSRNHRAQLEIPEDSPILANAQKRRPIIEGVEKYRSSRIKPNEQRRKRHERTHKHDKQCRQQKIKRAFRHSSPPFQFRALKLHDRDGPDHGHLPPRLPSLRHIRSVLHHPLRCIGKGQNLLPSLRIHRRISNVNLVHHVEAMEVLEALPRLGINMLDPFNDAIPKLGMPRKFPQQGICGLPLPDNDDPMRANALAEKEVLNGPDNEPTDEYEENGKNEETKDKKTGKENLPRKKQEENHEHEQRRAGVSDPDNFFPQRTSA